MDKWDRFLEDSIKRDKEYKQDSREHEIWILENSDKLPNNVAQEALEIERAYRKNLDEHIEHCREWLMDRKDA